MDIGVGLPTNMPGVGGSLNVAWARRAEELGFTSLLATHRLVYNNYDPLTSLAAVSSVTEKVRLTTGIVLAPLYSTALLAKTAATIDSMSNGRLVLGVGVGGRDDDFEAGQVAMKGRGARFTQQLLDMKLIWSGEPYGTSGPIGPRPVRPGGPELLIGGSSDAAIERTCRVGDGAISGAYGSEPERFRIFAQAVRERWAARGRSGSPRMVAVNFYALGSNPEEHTHGFMLDYFKQGGLEAAKRAAASTLSGAAAVASAVKALTASGVCDEFILIPCNPVMEQLDRLRQVV